MKPIWEEEIVYNETVMFVGREDEAPLLYPATEIISVRSYDLKTEYIRGIDYEYNENNNSILMLKDGIMPFMDEEIYYPNRIINGMTFACTNPDRSYIQCSEGSFFCEKQIAVTYRHSGAVIEKPVAQNEAFEKTMQKLKNNERVKILFYGDSITVGANASGYKEVNYPPYADIWAQMVFKSIVKKHGATNAEYINTAVGGWSSGNGLENLDEGVISYAPDAVFLAFGMNDGALTPTQHIKNIRIMIERIWSALPFAEICLVTPMLANAEVKGFYCRQADFEFEYLKLLEDCRKQRQTGLCVANVTKLHKQLLEYKRYYDMTGNNVNHPNDFLSRVYAQAVFQTVCGN
ncbi:MAG: hypothetical protein E7360_06710 [Clostridiales bacterium]|nr:hypothetical protein [Clostridiales bacterium]